MQVADHDAADPPVPTAVAVDRATGRRHVPALVLALVAVVSAVLLPFAPVEMSAPTVSWPQDPGSPSSTMLELNNRTPLWLDVDFSCAALRATGPAGGVVLATMLPGDPLTAQEALLVTTAAGRLTILDRGRSVLEEALPAGDCRYTLSGRPDRLTVERDGTRLAELLPTADGPVLPTVEVLATDVTQLPGEDDLGLRLGVDDQFNTTPAPLKQVLVVVLLIAAVGSLVALRRSDRRPGPSGAGPLPGPGVDGGTGRAPGDTPSRLLVHLVDVAVVGTVLLWWFIAPMSDDDGYYAAMARNSGVEGFVGNYYQLLNQSFTPFTWFYRVLGWWEQVGDSPVVLRVPALVMGLATWLLMRRFVTQPGALAATSPGRWVRLGTVVLLGAAFLAWWLPYGMGVRPEAVVAGLAMATLSCVTAGLRRGRLFPLGVGVGLAGLAVGCHPTGAVALAPLIVALPRIVPLVTAGGGRLAVATRTALLLAPGAFPAAAAFADGSLNDFRRGQEIFLSYQDQSAWFDEWQRYGFLLGPGPMGSYAKRAAVLLAIVSLVWFLVLAVAARTRQVQVPLTLRMAGLSLGAGFLLLWVTPSKWTHHFGALSGLGPVFLALVLSVSPVLVREVQGGRRLGWPVPLAVLGSGVVAYALAFRGPNQWAYTWAPGMPHADVPPFVGPVHLDSLLVWLGLTAVVVAVVALWRRRRPERGAPAWLVAVPLVATLFLLTSVGHLVGSFGYATVRTLDTWSPWADAVSDPLARDCGAAAAVRAGDLDAARPAAVAVPAAAPSAPFVAGAGWAGVDPPPGTPGQGITRDVWGSLTTPGSEDLTGEMTTSWYTLPTTAEDEQLAVVAAGRLGEGNRLVVQYATVPAAGEPVVIATEPLQDAADSPNWRTFVLDGEPARQAGATALRLVATDVSGGTGGWLAFTGPAVTPVVSLQELVPADAAVGVAWQLSFFFPCQRQPDIRYGITEPVRYGVLWVGDPATSGLQDNTWLPGRGLFGPVHSTASLTQLATTVIGSPGVQAVQVERLGLPYPVAGYDLRVDRERRFGWQGP